MKRPPLEEYEKVAEDATPGPWDVVDGMLGSSSGWPPMVASTACEVYIFSRLPESTKLKPITDAFYIAAAREGWPATIAYAKALEAMLKELEFCVDADSAVAHSFCPICQETEWKGHKPTCELNKLLRGE
jgi:hypothetical protein